MKIGVYSQQKTILHGLNPAVKIACSLVFLAACAMAQSVVGLLAACAFTVVVLACGRVTPKTALKILRPMIPLMVFVAVLDIAVCGGVVVAATSIVRFVCSLLGAALLMRTTSPTELADGVRILLTPLTKAGIKTDSFIFAVQATFRFIPVLFGELGEIRQAQRERVGVTFGATSQGQVDEASTASLSTKNGEGKGRSASKSKEGLATKVKSTIPLMVPLFDSALRRADMLAIAINNRGFGAATRRTSIRSYNMHPANILAAALTIALLAIAIIA
jgi:energy-coupling factor transport system permease protein